MVCCHSLSLTAGVLGMLEAVYLHSLFSVHGPVSHEFASLPSEAVDTVCLSSLLWQQVPEVHYSLWKVLLSELNQSPVSFIECPLLLFLVLQILFCLILLACSYPLFPDSVNCDHTSFWLSPLNRRVLDCAV